MAGVKKDTTKDIKRLAFALEQERESRGLNLRDAAEAISNAGAGTISHGQLSRIIRRKSVPGEVTYLALCAWLEVDPETYRIH